MKLPEDLRCCVCLAASPEMLLTRCPHRLCARCAQGGQLEACPVCRLELPPGRPRDEAFAREAAVRRLRCACGAEVPLLEAEGHECNHVRRGAAQPEWRPGEAAGVPRVPPPAAPNRSTFTCPLCGEANLSREGLIAHCDSQHGRRTVAAVCPVCAAMPWGDPSYVSGDFLSHLRLRHRCDYEVLADFEADEDTMLRRAIVASLAEAAGGGLRAC